MVGSLVMVGIGAWTADDLSKALAACDRSACGQVAPPDGLYLMRVDYWKDFHIAGRPAEGACRNLADANDSANFIAWPGAWLPVLCKHGLRKSALARTSA